ncbi:dihydrofolate reductase, partial [Escherichia coli]|uniref:dihydrofolate reductase n=1 Tax=Escherichia coli TaxID=562 RepID=UPI003CE46419
MNSESVRIYLVAAMGANRVIGNGPNIPWKIPGEQKIFRRLTEGKGHCCKVSDEAAFCLIQRP